MLLVGLLPARCDPAALSDCPSLPRRGPCTTGPAQCTHAAPGVVSACVREGATWIPLTFSPPGSFCAPPRVASWKRVGSLLSDQRYNVGGNPGHSLEIFQQYLTFRD